MRRAWWCVLLVAGAAACKTDAARRAEVVACSERSGDALEIELCLSGNYGWKAPEARTAGIARAGELDSLERVRDDSLWALSAARRRDEIRKCGDQDLAPCLLVTYAWPPRRAEAAAESVWRAELPRHQREIRQCAAEYQTGVGACLQLKYKWLQARALALDDSIMRARMR